MADNPKRIGDDLLLDELRRREDILHGAADVINSKASQIFAAAAFLAVQPALILGMSDFQGKTVPLRVLLAISEIIAICATTFSVIRAHMALKISDYAVTLPDDEWRDRVVARTKPIDGVSMEDLRRADIVDGLLLGTEKRCVNIEKVNELRLAHLEPARDAIYAALLLNAFSLILYAFIRLF